MYFYFIKIVLLVKMCCGKFSGGVENTIQHLIIRTLFTNLNQNTYEKILFVDGAYDGIRTIVCRL